MKLFILATTTEDADEITVSVHPTHAEAVECIRDTFIGDDGPDMTDEQVLARIADWTEVNTTILEYDVPE